MDYYLHALPKQQDAADRFSARFAEYGNPEKGNRRGFFAGGFSGDAVSSGGVGTRVVFLGVPFAIGVRSSCGDAVGSAAAGCAETTVVSGGVCVIGVCSICAGDAFGAEAAGGVDFVERPLRSNQQPLHRCSERLLAVPQREHMIVTASR